MRKSLLNIVLFVLAAALCSCEHKELCYRHPHMASVKIEFDWKDAPKANPAGMSVFFYPAEGESLPARRFDLDGKAGGVIDILAGKYRVICHNNDTGITMMRGTDGFDTNKAFTRECDLFETVYGNSAGSRVPRASGAEDERVVISPDMLWGCAESDVEVADNGTGHVEIPKSGKAGPSQAITLKPHRLVCTYTCEITGVTGLDHVSKMCGTLSGMAPSLLFQDESLGSERVTIPFEVRAKDATTIVGEFLTFGHNEGNDSGHRLLLYVWMDNGEKFCYGTEGGRFNVTSQVRSAPDRRHVRITIDGLGLPKPIGGDLNVSTDDWNEVNEDIHI